MNTPLTFNKTFNNWLMLAALLVSIIAGICILISQFYIPFILIILFTFIILMIKFRLIGIITIIALSMGLVNVLALRTIIIMGGDFNLRDFMFFLVCFIETIRMLYNNSPFQKNSFAKLFIIIYLIVGFSIFRSMIILELSEVNIFREFRDLIFYSIYFIGLMTIRNKNDIDVILKTIIILSGIVSLMHIFQGLTGIPIMEGRLETASVGELEFTGVRRVLSSGVIFVTFSFYYLTLNVIYRTYIFPKKYVYLLISLYLTMLLMTFGRMSWISIFFGLFVIMFLLDKIYRKRLLYLLFIGCLLILVVLAASPAENKRPLYPGYRLLKQAGRAMSSLTSRMFSSRDYFEKIAQTIGIPGAVLMKDWTERTKLINSVPTGGWRRFLHEVPFPEKFGVDTD